MNELAALDRPHAHSGVDAARLLAVDPAVGLTAAEVALRRAKHGPNALPAGEPVSMFAIVARQLDDLMTRILLVASAVALISWWLGGAHGLPGDFLVIVAIVAFNVVLGAVQELRAEQTIRELERMAAVTAHVLRDGAPVELERGRLVPGDVVLLAAGDRVPADLLLVAAERLDVDESALTGESAAVEKHVGPVDAQAPVDARAGVAFAGSTVTGGRARGLVVATGARTQLGGVAHGLSTDRVPTPLEERLEVLGRQIGIGVTAIAVLIALNLLVLDGASSLDGCARILMFAVALAVAAVPEGLPTVLTVALALGARRLARRNAVVRRMSAVETLGAVTTIVTDKTGTLTCNQMTARVLHVAGRDLAVSGTGYAGAGAIADAAQVAGRVELACAIGVLAGDGAVADGHAVGDPTDAALVVLAGKAGLDVAALRAGAPRLAEVPFSSERRRTTVVARWRGRPWLFAKGSLEALEPLSVPEPGARAAEARLAGAGLRALALAARPLGAGETIADEHGLELVALVGLGDPLRDGVPAAVAACRRAGIGVVMLTGDHPATAQAIARQAGLDADRVVTGAEVERLDAAGLARELGRTRVFARVGPAAKQAIARALIARGEVLAMTGDGVNDAPALRAAHVGVAMGRCGTAVAVEASDMVLLDDDFATLVAAIAGGRSVHDTVRRFVAFLFSGNAGVVLAIFLGTIISRLYGMREAGQLLLPLTAAQILWMNLVTDGPPAVAFALAPPVPGGMERPPRDPRSPILGPRMWAYVLITGTTVAAYLLVVLDLFHAGGLITFEPRGAVYARSAGLLAVISARLFNALNFNVLPATLLARDGWRHAAVPVAAFASWALTLAVVQVAGWGALLGLVPLSWSHALAVSLGGAVVLLPGYLMQRLWPPL